jgi:transcription elongation factor Elf1
VESPTIQLCCKSCHRIFSVTLTTANTRDGWIKCPLCGVTTTYAVAQMLEPAA